MNARLIRGDCLQVLAAMPDNSIDSIVTDPPYGLKFMGKRWDYDVPSIEVWAECLRVLKPGGYLLSFGGTRTYHRLATRIEDAGFILHPMLAWIFGQGFPKATRVELAEMDDFRYGLQSLKPAIEPICMAQKAFSEKTGTANVARWGTGALNIGGCRVEPTGESRDRVGEASRDRRYKEHGSTNFAATPGIRGGDPAGRWPANVIHDGSDEVMAAFPQAPGQMAKASTSETQRAGQDTYGVMARGSNGQEPRGDTGSAARFFYCAKASRRDRGPGNNHSTVKPTELMRYLCRLVTPPAGIVLDPFTGSGSTGKAAILEGFRFIGIERDLDDHGQPAGYIEIASARIGHAGATVTVDDAANDNRPAVANKGCA